MKIWHLVSSYLRQPFDRFGLLSVQRNGVLSALGFPDLGGIIAVFLGANALNTLIERGGAARLHHNAVLELSTVLGPKDKILFNNLHTACLQSRCRF